MVAPMAACPLRVIIVSNTMPAAVSKAVFTVCVLFEPGCAFLPWTPVHRHQKWTLQVVS